ncbi:hypothetical protein PVK06_019500 [Gossypium arboreum]|uniref:Uncharacterized protein n=1 Tax=Gossypium arboreum TaxID=29729 RepID=A0ABR0PJX8_GOSAR|nr:hypothetical protein PVK06_019500 [Gossypium arboreum]
MSWLLSTIDAELLPSFTNARSACDVWTTAIELFAVDIGLRISDEEKLEIILAGLLLEFEGMVSSAYLSIGPLQRVVNALVECENRLHRVTQEISLHANLVEPMPSLVVEGSVRGGRSSPHGRGSSFQPRI